MYLALDIGNSNIVGAVFPNDHTTFSAIHSFRLVTPSSTTTDELALSIKGMLTHHHIDPSKIEAAIFSSVVPSLNHNITKLMQTYFDIGIDMVTHEHFADWVIDYKDPEDLGIDRLVNMKATENLFGSPAIIIDFGTALTIDLLSAPKTFAGGLILPGIAISLDALIRETSQLPKVELEAPKSLLANSTKKNIQHGLYFLYQRSVENIVASITEEHFTRVGQSAPQVIVTGGLAPFITHAFQRNPQNISLLTLIGLKMILSEIQLKKATLHAK